MGMERLLRNQAEGAYLEDGKGLTTVDMIPHGEKRMYVKLGDMYPVEEIPGENYPKSLGSSSSP